MNLRKEAKLQDMENEVWARLAALQDFLYGRFVDMGKLSARDPDFLKRVQRLEAASNRLYTATGDLHDAMLSKKDQVPF